MTTKEDNGKFSIYIPKATTKMTCKEIHTYTHTHTHTNTIGRTNFWQDSLRSPTDPSPSETGENYFKNNNTESLWKWS